MRIRYRYVRGDRAHRTVVLVQGRGEFVEKYAEVIDELTSRGFDVWTADLRGQGRSSRPFRNRHRGWVDSFDSYIADLDAFVSRVVDPGDRFPTRRVLLAHSLGAHIATRYLLGNARAFQRAVLTAPLIGLVGDTHIRRAFIHLVAQVGLGRVYATAEKDYGTIQRTFENNRLTHDPERFAVKARCIDADPELAVGGPTFGWVSALLRSIDALRADPRLPLVPTGVVVVTAGADEVVDSAAGRWLASTLPHGTWHEIEGSAHEILFEGDPIRDQFWAIFDAFVDATGAPSAPGRSRSPT